MLKVFILAFTSIIISACSYHAESLPGGGSQPDSALNAEAFISYDLIRTTSLRTCSNCHSGAEEPDLGSLTEIQNNLDLIHDETSSASMPPAELGYKALDACNQAVLDQWLSMGAPETTTLQVKSIPACSHDIR